MDALVKMLRSIERDCVLSGVHFEVRGETVEVIGAPHPTTLSIVRLYRPSSTDILQAAAPGKLLAITHASSKAAAAAAATNHVILPAGGYRVVAPGIAIFKPSPPSSPTGPRRAKLAGRSGVIAETLLLEPNQRWSITGLARRARVSIGLAHRALVRLEREGIVGASGAGPDKVRFLLHPTALAELWSQEEVPPPPVWRGYVYAPSSENIAHRVLDECPQAAVAGVLAANSYEPFLTQVPAPVQVWVPQDFDIQTLGQAGFQETGEGANVELLCGKDGDPWQVHAAGADLRKVSPWRAWVEISHARGRAKELADRLALRLRGS